jgi:prepilin signal peptidase PulO-like enzyme (type II secretory pathway)
VGSFVNVVVLRSEKKESIVKTKSHCFKCGHKLNFWELIPVVSYLFLKGKCSQCKEKISIMYPLVEFFIGLLFVCSY